MNSIELAFLGDAVYEQFVRERLVRQGSFGGHADRLHKEAVKYVKAGAQAAVIKVFMKAAEAAEEENASIREESPEASAKASGSITKGGQTAPLILTEDERRVVTRARNHKIATKAKNASAADYKWATGFEALIGYLKLSGQEERLNEILEAAAAFIGK